MTASFTKTALTNDRYLARGTDQFGTAGSAVLDGSEFNRFEQRDRCLSAHESFDQKVSEFFAPIMQATEELNEAHSRKLDPLTYVVEREAVEAVAAQSEILTILDADTVVLRAIALNEFDRLVWVGDSLEVLAEEEPDAAEEPVSLADSLSNMGFAAAALLGEDFAQTAQSDEISDVDDVTPTSDDDAR